MGCSQSLHPVGWGVWGVKGWVGVFFFFFFFFFLGGGGVRRSRPGGNTSYISHKLWVQGIFYYFSRVTLFTSSFTCSTGAIDKELRWHISYLLRIFYFFRISIKNKNVLKSL